MSVVDLLNKPVPQSLAEPLVLPCGALIKNRFLKSAMSEVLADRHHQPGLGHVQLYSQWAQGGVGLQITGNVMVDRRALGEPRNVVFDDLLSVHFAELWARAATSHQTHCWVQLNHPGKQSPVAINADPVAPSAIPLGNGLEKFFKSPRALTEDEISEIIQKFAYAARIAKSVGFTGVQIHGAHGYLVNQFLSPQHNRRNDGWGGCLENRMRFVSEIYQAIRAEVGGDFPVGIKLNSADFQRGGFTEDESAQVMVALDEMGMDLFEVSGGNYESPAFVQKESSRQREAYFMDFAARVKQSVKAPVVVTGGFRTAEAMESAVVSGGVDMIGLGRPLLLDPDLPRRVLAGESVTSQVKPLKSGIKAIDGTGMLEITWYEQQMARMARGKPPQPDMNIYWSMMRTLFSTGIQAFQKRRA